MFPYDITPAQPVVYDSENLERKRDASCAYEKIWAINTLNKMYNYP